MGEGERSRVWVLVWHRWRILTDQSSGFILSVDVGSLMFEFRLEK